MKAAQLTAILLMASNTINAADELNVEFLEWLGQTAEVEELGMDMNDILTEQEQKADAENNAENNK
jgi:hypothetical protein